MSGHTRRVPRFRRALVAASSVAVVAALTASSAVAQQPPDPAPPETATTPTAPRPSTDLGRVAYVTPGGDVVVADSDGANPVTIGSGAATNAAGLAPLAWRQPAADAITYVRTDGALVVAPVDGSPATTLASDAVVPPDADENILSWDVSGSLLIYLARTPSDGVESRVVDLTQAGDGEPPEVRPIGESARRVVQAQSFSPLDPIIVQRTSDPETGRLFTLAVVEPFNGALIGSTFSLDDIAFSPDGRYAFGVAKGTGDVQQLVRISLRNPRRREPVTDRGRICRPSISPDARMIVFAAGRRCQDVWTLRSNGTRPRRIARMRDGVTFEHGDFTWSRDSRTISHADCRRRGSRVVCEGGYWDLSVDGDDPVQRAAAGSVLREELPLLRPVKVSVDITGPIHYSGQMQMGAESFADPLAPSANQVVRVKGVDENDNARSYELKLIHPENEVWVAGTLRIVDGGFDETFPFFGRLAPYSLGFAKLRGLWTRSQRLPFQSGHIVLTIER